MKLPQHQSTLETNMMQSIETITSSECVFYTSDQTVPKNNSEELKTERETEMVGELVFYPNTHEANLKSDSDGGLAILECKQCLFKISVTSTSVEALSSSYVQMDFHGLDTHKCK